MSDEITISRIDHALHIRLDRAAKRNALTLSMYETMADGIAQAESDETVRAVLFSGAGEAFCAGNDLGDFLTNPPNDTNSQAFRFLRAISTATKVLVAAVHGAAVGVGATMLLHCDFVVAARSARLSMPFVKMGLAPEAASTLLLPRTIGHLRAVELLLLGESIDAEIALRWGIVNRVVEDEALIGTACEYVARIASLPASAVRISKQLLKDDRAGVSLRIEQEGSIFVARLRSPELQKIARVFLDKRAVDSSRFV